MHRRWRDVEPPEKVGGMFPAATREAGESAIVDSLNAD
jgi:hypothetical protein